MPSIIKVDQIQSDTGTVNQTSNLSFTGTGRRITGDFTNATVANRVLFQSNETNGTTLIGAIPNGTATVCSFQAYNNSDPTNAAFFNFGCSLSGTEARLNSAINGTGSYLPMTFYTGGSERMRITTAGVVELTSGQLKFPAAQNASSDPNTLDDYEEGTFSATWWSGQNGTGTNLGTSTGSLYTRIGRVVVVNFNRAGVGVGTTSSFTGLPFSLVNGVESCTTADSVFGYGDTTYPTAISFRSADGIYCRGTLVYQV
jgi:hypothetical protein